MKLETYGKLNPVRKVYRDVKYRFVIDEVIEKYWQRNRCGVYVPKLNRTRFGIACFITAILIIVPCVTLLGIPVMMWGIK